MKRGIRRHHLFRLKSKMKRMISIWNISPKSKLKLLEDEKFVGRLVSTHGKPCSCYMCSGWKKDCKQISEMKRDEDVKNQMDEVFAKGEKTSIF